MQNVVATSSSVPPAWLLNQGGDLLQNPVNSDAHPGLLASNREVGILIESVTLTIQVLNPMPKLRTPKEPAPFIRQ